jgi:hypothetical protein
MLPVSGYEKLLTAEESLSGIWEKRGEVSWELTVYQPARFGS